MLVLPVAVRQLKLAQYKRFRLPHTFRQCMINVMMFKTRGDSLKKLGLKQ